MLLQYRWLSKDYPYTGRLRLAYRIKGTIAFLLILLSVAFGVAMYKAVNVGGQFLAFAFPVQANKRSTFDSRSGMGHRFWIRLLLDFLLLGSQTVEARKIGQLQSRKTCSQALGFPYCSPIPSRIAHV